MCEALRPYDPISHLGERGQAHRAAGGNNRHVHQYVDEWIDVAEAAREDIIDFNYDRQRRAGQDTPVGKADRNRIRFSSLQSTMFENARGLHMRRSAPGATATVCRFGVDAHQPVIPEFVVARVSSSQQD